jgi:hypothetical protein
LGLPGAVIRTTRISSSCQLVEQRLCLFEVGGLEALGEPAVDRREEVAGFPPPALLAPQPCKADGGAQFQRFRLLGLGDADRLLKGGLALVELVLGEQYSPGKPVEFGFPPALATFRRNGVSISQSRESAVVVA